MREALDSGQPVNSRSPGGVTGLMSLKDYFDNFDHDADDVGDGDCATCKDTSWMCVSCIQYNIYL